MTDKTPPKPENLWLNLACNIVLPGLVLTKLSAPERLGPVGALILGVSLPLGYGLYDLVTRRKWNVFSIVGLASVALTGTLGLLHVGSLGFAVKEATVPALFAVTVLTTLKTRRPLVREMIFNDAAIDVPRVEAALAEKGTRPAFDRLLATSTWLLAGSFALSSVLNFILARVLLKSTPGTPEFAAELGRMAWLSWPVIALPSILILIFILWRLLSGVTRLTGLPLETVMRGGERRAEADAPSGDR